MEAVYVKDLEVSFNGENVLSEVSFKLNHPSAMCIMGPNGAGKTTLLKVLLGLIKPLHGLVRVFGFNPFKNPLEVRRITGYVPQRELIDPTLPLLVKDVVLMGRIVRGFGRYTEEDYKEAEKALKMVGMLDFWDEPFSHLSGGQQQRVLIARALARKPKLLLLDEPLAGVDPETSLHVAKLLRDLKDKVTVVVVTHDQSLVKHIADVVLVLNKKPVFLGSPIKWLEVGVGWSGEC